LFNARNKTKPSKVCVSREIREDTSEVGRTGIAEKLMAGRSIGCSTDKCRQLGHAEEETRVPKKTMIDVIGLKSTYRWSFGYIGER